LRTLQISSRALVAALVIFTASAPHRASAQPKTLYRFQAARPSPYGGVTVGPGGVLYGTTYDGGASGSGTVFSLTPPATPGGAWTEAELFEFGSTGPVGPLSGVTVGTGGVLYGTTYAGGTAYEGTVFSLTPPATPGGAWTEAILHSFDNVSGSDGNVPWAGVAVGNNRELYGTTVYGGPQDMGTVYELTPPASPGGTWTETIIYNFTGEDAPLYPYGGVIAAKQSNGQPVLYGTTFSGDQEGVVYSLTPPTSGSGDWTFTILHDFFGNQLGTGDGGGPYTGLVMDSQGTLYGPTYYGGASAACGGGCGTIFSVTPDGVFSTESALYSFTGGIDGANPEARLALGSGGVLYGVTLTGGNANGGTIFSLTPPAKTGGAWTWKLIFSFNGKTNGYWPGPLTAGKSGALFGTTYANPSAVFELIP